MGGALTRCDGDSHVALVMRRFRRVCAAVGSKARLRTSPSVFRVSDELTLLILSQIEESASYPAAQRFPTQQNT